MDTINYAYKIGIKEDIINSLRKVFESDYPDQELASRISIVSEYPINEVQYPMVVIRFNSSRLDNIGIGHYELSDDVPYSRILHWIFEGTLNFTVNALTPLDRDKVIVGLLNLFAFGPDIPVFQNFRDQIMNQEFVTMTLMTDSIQETGDSVTNPSWDQNNELVFTDSLILRVIGEFFTEPTTGNLIEIDTINLYPYQPGQSIPAGSQVGNDPQVPWQP